MQSKNIFFQSLGCSKNLVDTEVMVGLTLKHGYQAVRTPDIADIIVINTCSFIDASKKESIDSILDLSEYKKNGTCKKLIVTGCLSQRYRQELVETLPEVDAFLGTSQYQDIVSFLESTTKTSDRNFKHPLYIHDHTIERVNSQPFYRAYLKIAEGCIKRCSFCIIPTLRGTLRSRPIPSLIEEAHRLVDGGVRELNLIAQDLTDYGRDLRDGTNLLLLLKELEKISHLRWIRLLYVYPDLLDDELIEFIKTSRKVCKYLDMPIQHISDRLLTLMNRKVTGALLRERIMRLKNAIPNLSLRTTVMVGYPSETEEEFKELLSFIKEFTFDHLGVFAYSLEEGTKSFSHPGHLDPETKERRRLAVFESQKKISRKNIKKKIGSEMEIMVETQASSPYLGFGRHSGQAPDVDGIVLIKEHLNPLERMGKRHVSFSAGEFIQCRVEQVLDYDLIVQPM